MMVVSDWDGTVCHAASVNYDDPDDLLQQCRPRPLVLTRLIELASRGHQLAVVTGRSPHVAHATRAQARQWLGDLGLSIPLVHRPRPQFNWKHYTHDKARSLRHLRAEVYVGDRPEDRDAAEQAGVAFLWDYEFEEHGLAALERRSATLRPMAGEA